MNGCEWMSDWMSERITHLVTWCSIYEDLPNKFSRAQDQEKLVSAAILELPFSLASCLFQNQFIATRRAQRTPMQKRAFTKPSLTGTLILLSLLVPQGLHSCPSTRALVGVLWWASHPAFSALCPLSTHSASLECGSCTWPLSFCDLSHVSVFDACDAQPWKSLSLLQRTPTSDPPTTRQWELYHPLCFPLLRGCQETQSYVLCPAALFNWGF